MQDWQERLVRNSGYTVDGEISRSMVIDATAWGSKKEWQTVRKYTFFETNGPNITIDMGMSLDGLDSWSIMALLSQAQQEMSDWSESIFGEENGAKQEYVLRQGSGTSDEAYEEANARDDIKEKKDQMEKLAKLEKPNDEEIKELNELSKDIVSVRDGAFGKHIGYAPVFSQTPDYEKSKESNVEKLGSGEMGAIMLDFEWNSMKAKNGFAELGKPMYDRKLWSDEILGMEPPTVRGVADIAMTIVGTALGGVGATLLGFVDDLLFAGLDLAGGYKTAGEVGNALAKKALTAAVGAGVGALGGAIGTKILDAGLSGAGKILADMGSAALTSGLSTVANTAIGAMDFTQMGKGGFFNTDQFTSSMSSMDTW